MAKRIVRLLPCLLTCLFLLGSLVTFAGALTPSGAPDYSKWDVPEVLNREDLTEQFPDGSFRLDLTTIRIVGIKQATYMLIWSREPLDETVQRDVVAAFRENDPSNYTDIAFYHGTGVFEKPSFWNKGNSFGRYGITREGDTWYLTIGGAGSVSHFVFGFGTTSEPTTTTSEPTTTTSEPTTTTSEPTTTTSEPTTTTSVPTTTTSESTTTTSEPTTTTSVPTTTTSESTTTTSESTTTTSEPTTTTSGSTTTTSEPTTTTGEPTTTTCEPTTTTGEPTTTTGEPTTTTTVPDLEIIDDEETPLADLPQGSDPAGSPKTGNTALPWLFIGAAAISLTVAVLINQRPAQEA